MCNVIPFWRIKEYYFILIAFIWRY